MVAVGDEGCWWSECRDEPGPSLCAASSVVLTCSDEPRSALALAPARPSRASRYAGRGLRVPVSRRRGRRSALPASMIGIYIRRKVPASCIAFVQEAFLELSAASSAAPTTFSVIILSEPLLLGEGTKRPFLPLAEGPIPCANPVSPPPTKTLSARETTTKARIGLVVPAEASQAASESSLTT